MFCKNVSTVTRFGIFGLKQTRVLRIASGPLRWEKDRKGALRAAGTSKQASKRFQAWKVFLKSSNGLLQRRKRQMTKASIYLTSVGLTSSKAQRLKDLCPSRLTCLSSRVRKPCLHMPSHNIEAHVDHLERFARIEHRDIHEEQDLRHDDSAGYLHGGEKRPSWFDILDWGKKLHI